MSYKILSQHYEGPPSVRVSPKVDAKDIKSNQGMAIDRESTKGGQPTHGSYGHAAPTVILTKDGVVTRSSNNKFETSYRDYNRNGPVTQIDDYYFGHWIKAGTDVRPNMFSLIPKMTDFGLIESPRLGMYFPNERDTPVSLRTSHDIVNAVNPNRLGYFHSKLANFNQELKNLIYDNTNRLNYEATEWVNFLAKKGISVDTSSNPGVTGLGVEKGNFLAAYYPGKGYLVREENFHNKAKNLISRYGLSDRESVEAMKRSVLLHEFAHVLGIGGSRKDEKLQGMLQAEFYSVMAQRFKVTKIERIYRELSQEGEDYAKDFSPSLLDLIVGEKKEDNIELRKIEHKFLKEAIELCVEDVEGYVNMRMEETLGPVLRGEPSYKPSRNNSKSKNKISNSRKLEEIVDESDKASFTITEDGNLAPTYEGRRVYGEGASMSTKFIGKEIKESGDEIKSEKEASQEAEASSSN